MFGMVELGEDAGFGQIGLDVFGREIRRDWAP